MGKAMKPSDLDDDPYVALQIRGARTMAAILARILPTQFGARRPRCYVCGNLASWRIFLAGEDEQRTEEEACELHARGHLRIAPKAA
jgi:hypothetical protein